jgi:hypothetical protein
MICDRLLPRGNTNIDRALSSYVRRIEGLFDLD